MPTSEMNLICVLTIWIIFIIYYILNEEILGPSDVYGKYVFIKLQRVTYSSSLIYGQRIYCYE